MSTPKKLSVQDWLVFENSFREDMEIIDCPNRAVQEAYRKLEAWKDSIVEKGAAPL